MLKSKILVELVNPHLDDIDNHSGQAEEECPRLLYEKVESENI